MSDELRTDMAGAAIDPLELASRTMVSIAPNAKGALRVVLQIEHAQGACRVAYQAKNAATLGRSLLEAGRAISARELTLPGDGGIVVPRHPSH